MASTVMCKIGWCLIAKVNYEGKSLRLYSHSTVGSISMWPIPGVRLLLVGVDLFELLSLWLCRLERLDERMTLLGDLVLPVNEQFICRREPLDVRLLVLAPLEDSFSFRCHLIAGPFDIGPSIFSARLNSFSRLKKAMTDVYNKRVCELLKLKKSCY